MLRAVVASHAVFSSAKVRIATIKEAACDCIREGGVISTENREKNDATDAGDECCGLGSQWASEGQ